VGDAAHPLCGACRPLRRGRPPRAAHAAHRQNIFQTFCASQRYATYLSVPATGASGDLELPPGATPETELIAGPHVEVGSWSWFSPEPTTGDFASEIRLGYVVDGGSRRPFTGGLLVGNVLDALANVRWTQRPASMAATWARRRRVCSLRSPSRTRERLVGRHRAASPNQTVSGTNETVSPRRLRRSPFPPHPLSSEKVSRLESWRRGRVLGDGELRSPSRKTSPSADLAAMGLAHAGEGSEGVCVEYGSRGGAGIGCNG
jgi:hypothetical protein